MKKVIFLILFVFTFGIQDILSQVSTELKPLSKEELDASTRVPEILQDQMQKTMAACAGNSPNDNFANAQTLVINGGLVTGTVCGTLEAGEKWGCATTPNMSVWYKFVATATTHYVQSTILSGSCFYGFIIYENLTGVPTNTCGSYGSQYPISCQSGAGGPNTQLHQLTNLTIGNTYYIQVTANSGCAPTPGATFNLQVTTANPGGYITNQPPPNACSTASTGCYFAAPPTVNTVTSTCTSYPLAAANYSQNSIWQGTFQYTNSATVSNVSLQAIITSNCGGGNVNWFNWRLFDCSCNLIACATINSLTVVGLACGTCYRFEYQMELAFCSSFTTIWPFQNIPAVPIPCTVLPLELMYFDAKVNGEDGAVNLEWKTVSEKDIRSFRLERSTDGYNYIPIAKGIYAVGSGYKYTFSDRTTKENQMYYYKLIATNNSGNDEYERTIVLAAQIKHKDINLIPNPAENSVDVVLDKNNIYNSIEIYNTLGQKVKSVIPELEMSTFTIDLSDLSKGIYFVNVTTADDKVISKKLVKE